MGISGRRSLSLPSLLPPSFPPLSSPLLFPPPPPPSPPLSFPETHFLFHPLFVSPSTNPMTLRTSALLLTFSISLLTPLRPEKQVRRHHIQPSATTRHFSRRVRRPRFARVLLKSAQSLGVIAEGLLLLDVLELVFVFVFVEEVDVGGLDSEPPVVAGNWSCKGYGNPDERVGFVVGT
ncbi:hypothetical protein DFH27DRAFT_534639 [Peziza echinospora]|nr:hypothetical protein DFH27DRAFT_534639 [Peziza echinospora]